MQRDLAAGCWAAKRVRRIVRRQAGLSKGCALMPRAGARCEPVLPPPLEDEAGLGRTVEDGGLAVFKGREVRGLTMRSSSYIIEGVGGE